MVNIPSPGDVFAAFFAAGHQAEPAEVMFGPCDRTEAEPGPDEPVPFTLTGQAEAALDAGEPEPGAGTVSADAAAQAAYAAYLDAWTELANMPGVSERSVDQAAAAAEAGHRLDEAARAHYDACLERQRELDAAEPEPEAEP